MDEWLELEVHIRRRGRTQEAFAVIDIVRADTAGHEDTLRSHQYALQLPAMVEPAQMDVWSTVAMRQALAAFSFEYTRLREVQRLNNLKSQANEVIIASIIPSDLTTE